MGRDNETFAGITKIAKNLSETHEDSTPFVLHKEDGNIDIVGDPNKTENKKHNYVIKYRFSEREFDELFPNGVEAEVTTVAKHWKVIEVEYKDITVKPRRDLGMVGAITKVFPYFYELKDDGSMRRYNTEELTEVFFVAEDELIENMYRIVTFFLDIPKKEAEYMTCVSVLRTMGELIMDFPEVFNEAELFFG